MRSGVVFVIGCLQVEILFKAKTKKRLRSLKTPKHMQVSLQYAVKGSYRGEHILAYLRRWLDEWTPARQAANDWRILMLDVAKSHVDEAVMDLAASRGYICLFHYGCTTGIAQVNDTDCHAEYSRVYISLEEIKFAHQQLLDPGNISRTLQDVLDDACSAWASVDHRQGLQGHKRVGLTNNLDGSEDHYITREALTFWRLADMAEERRKAIQEVNDRIESGDLRSFSEDWRRLIVNPEDCGVVEEEGAELEGELVAGELHYEEDQQVAEDQAADLAAFDENAAEPKASVVAALPGDDPAEVEDASGAVRRLSQLKRLRSLAMSARVPSAAFAVCREVDLLERGLGAGSDNEKRKVNAVLRREMDKRFSAEAEKVKVSQKRAMQTKRALAKVKAAQLQASVKKKLEEAEKAATAKAVEALPKTVSVATAGAAGAVGKKNRAEALERLRLRSPKLPLEKDVRWCKLQDEYCERLPKSCHGPVGTFFVNKLNKILKRLGTHYKGTTVYNEKAKKDHGDAKAFERFFDEMDTMVPKPVLVAVLS